MSSEPLWYVVVLPKEGFPDGGSLAEQVQLAAAAAAGHSGYYEEVWRPGRKTGDHRRAEL
jgi:hypothetical protein